MKNIQFFRVITLFLISLGCSSILAETVTNGNSAEMNASAPQSPGSSSSGSPTGGSSAAKGTNPAASSTGGPSAAKGTNPAASPTGGSSATQETNSAASPAEGSSAAQSSDSSASQNTGTAASPTAEAPSTSQGAASKTSSSSGTETTASGKGTEKPQNSSSKDSGGDSSIVANIQANLATHSDLANANVEATSKNGRVKLMGNVTSEDKASEIIKIATSTKDVKDVDSTKLTVNNEKIDPDSVITSKIKGLLIRDKLFGSENIVKPLNVQTKNGVVTLTGTVTDQKYVKNAIKLAKAVKGVSKVKSEIVVIENKK